MGLAAAISLVCFPMAMSSTHTTIAVSPVGTGHITSMSEPMPWPGFTPAEPSGSSALRLERPLPHAHHTSSLRSPSPGGWWFLGHLACSLLSSLLVRQGGGTGGVGGCRVIIIFNPFSVQTHSSTYLGSPRGQVCSRKGTCLPSLRAAASSSQLCSWGYECCLNTRNHTLTPVQLHTYWG